MLVDQPQLLQDNQDNADESFSGGTNLPLRVTLLVCRVSGNPLSSAEFRQNFPTSFCPRGERVHLSNTMCTSRNGPRFVCQDKVISCVPLFAYLEQLTPLHKLKLKELTLKLALLIALVTGQSCQTLSSLDISGEHMK